MSSEQKAARLEENCKKEGKKPTRIQKGSDTLAANETAA